MKFRQLFFKSPPKAEPDATSECHDSSATTTNDTPLSTTSLLESSVAPIAVEEIFINCEAVNHRPLDSNFRQEEVDFESTHSGVENGSEDKDKAEIAMEFFENRDAKSSNRSATSFLVELDLYQNLPSLHTLAASSNVNNNQIAKKIARKSKRMQQVSERVEEDIHRGGGGGNKHEDIVESGMHDTNVPGEIFGEIPDLPTSDDNTSRATVSAIHPIELYQLLSITNFDLSHLQPLPRAPSSLNGGTLDVSYSSDDEASKFMSHIHLLREVNLRMCTKNTPSPSTDEYIGGSDGSPENDENLFIPSTARTVRASASAPELRSRRFRALKHSKDKDATAIKSSSAFNPTQNSIQHESQMKKIWARWKLIGLAISAGSTAVVVAMLWGSEKGKSVL